MTTRLLLAVALLAFPLTPAGASMRAVEAPERKSPLPAIPYSLFPIPSRS
jgi:hypothetical protein